jgi:hypothetical protein
MLFGSNHGGKKIHIDSTSPLPHYKIKTYGTWAASTSIYNVQFEGFDYNETACGAETRIFGLNPHASDYIPIHNFEYTTFKNVNHDNLIFLMDPPESWNNPTDCSGFPCTAPSNVLMSFKYTTFEGSTKPDFDEKSFQIVSDTPGASETLNNCEH